MILTIIDTKSEYPIKYWKGGKGWSIMNTRRIWPIVIIQVCPEGLIVAKMAGIVSVKPEPILFSWEG